MKVIIQGVLLAVLGLVLSGCASKVSGHRLQDINAPITKLNYVVLPTQINNPVLSHLRGPTRDLTTLLAQRTPKLFALNGIEASHQGDGQYTFVINQKTIFQYFNPGGSMLVKVIIATYITSTADPAKKIWEGDASYGYSINAMPDEKSVDNLAKDILEQLSSDGVVKLSTNEIKVTTSNSQENAESIPDVYNADAVPLPAPDKQRHSYDSYLTMATPKAFVICRDGRVMMFSAGMNIIEKKLTTLPEGCAPYAVNDAVVWVGI